ncbi:helix-turn-helix domain-containing protein [Bacillus sp. V3B]|uniref:helix-turn-helix domain-containing protein n=1 Tax=Bacillus sp. V3B TaxID=2804915 RepID=UPI00210DDCFC|nr:helix-turn-helix domain-containing protein [Bacillus sp. V3B]
MKQRSFFNKQDILTRFDEKEIISKFSYNEILSRLTKNEIYQKYTSDEILAVAKRYADEYTEGYITTYCIKGKWYTGFGMDGDKYNIEKLKEMAEGDHYIESLFNALYSEVYETETENDYNVENLVKLEIDKKKNKKVVKEIKRLPYLTTGEAEEKWSKPKGTIRNLIHRGKLENEIENGLIKRTGKLWMVDEKLMYELYGEPAETTERLVSVK